MKKVEKGAESASIVAIRSDNVTEFKNATLNAFCKEQGISHQFSAPRTPQQNGVVERKNRTLIEAARTMLQDAKLPTCFWAEAIQTACYIQNRTLINKDVGNVPYFIMSGKRPSFKHLHVFGSKCFVLKDNSEYVGKFDAKTFDAIFLGYSLDKTAYRVYVVDQQKVMESTDVSFDDSKFPGLKDDDDLAESEALKFENLTLSDDSEDDEPAQPQHQEEQSEPSEHCQSQRSSEPLLLGNSPMSGCNISGGASHATGSSNPGGASHFNESINSGGASSSQTNVPNNEDTSCQNNAHQRRRWNSYHSTENIIGDPNVGVRTRRSIENECLYGCFLSKVEPKKIEDALLDPDWIVAMQEELN